MRPGTEKKLDDIFSLYIRTKFSHQGICTCYTCGARYPISVIQNGHCFGRSNRGTRFDEDDCRPQCRNCNYYGDVIGIFKEKLLREIGEDRFNALRIKANQICKISEYEALDMIQSFKQKLKEYTDQN